MVSTTAITLQFYIERQGKRNPKTHNCDEQDNKISDKMFMKNQQPICSHRAKYATGQITAGEI